MARNVFRFTPRATQALRAVERFLRMRLDNDENQAEKVNFVINACDFCFSEEDGATVVRFEELEVMFTLPNDQECFLWEEQYVGWIEMKKHVVPDGRNQRKNFVYYTVVKVVLDKREEVAEAV